MNKEYLILSLNKKKNFTSYDVIRKFKRFLFFEKIGHCGTLDSSALGLLLLFMGNTKFISNFFNKNKRYIVFGVLGIDSDSYDMDGKIFFYEKKTYILDNFIIKYNLSLVCKRKLLHEPPIFSSLKHNGIRLYKYGRMNIKIFSKKKENKIFKIFLLYRLKNLIILDVKCDSGTYIRSLLNFLGKKIQVPFSVSVIYRVSIGKFDILNSYNF